MTREWKTTQDSAEEQYNRALARFTRNLESAREFYDYAIEGKGPAYADRLRDAALAMCGSPYHSISRKAKFNGEATLFLRYMAEHE